jgi:carboxyl-terminal processing protease
MVRLEREQLQGSFEGIGAYLEIRDGRVTIVSPIDGSPAQAAGIEPGEVIQKIDGEETAGLTLDQCVARIRGPAGTQVTLTILNPETQDSREITLTRARIEEVKVSWVRLPGTDTALLRVVSFSDGVTEDLQAALGEIRRQGLGTVVMDLRNNPGGLLAEAIGVASQFLDSGNVLLRRDSKGEVTAIPVLGGGAAVDLGLVVLINQGSASAAEIVSGALQDAKRALLVGETTFGTGTVLSTLPLTDGSALMLATQEWLTPSARVIWHRGIEPDVPVEPAQSGTILTPDQAAEMTPEELEASGDTQLLEALRLLTTED